MFRRLFVSVVIALGLTLIAQSSHAIQRVAPKFSFVEVYGGPTFPIGEYDNIAGIQFRDEQNRPITVDADAVFDPGFVLGVTYGQLLCKHLVASVGFRYTKVNVDDNLVFTLERPGINIYDIQFNGNWMVLDLSQNFWSPYVGLGIHAGFVEQSYENFSNEYEFIFDGGVNFGLDIKVWQSEVNDSFMSLSSINNLSVLASDERPQNFNLGFGLRYYFK